MGMPSIRAFLAVALFLALGLEAQETDNPVLHRRSLPSRMGPNAIKGHDLPDLRHAWDLYWFGGELSPSYMDYKNQLAAQEVQRWRHLFPKAQGSQLISAILPAPPGTGGVSWTNLGPIANLTPAGWSSIDSGRPVAIVPHPTVPTTLYLATSGGGVFKCINADTTTAASNWIWTAITDDLPASGSSGNVSIGAMAMSPADSKVLYVGLGDPFDAQGRGFFKTPDGGLTWTPAMGLGNQTRSYFILPVSANTVFWGTDDGLKVSTDGGASFSALAVGPAGRVWTIQKLTATDLLLSVQVGTTEGAGAGSIYYSADNGSTWNLASMSGAGLSTNIGRITIRTAGDTTTAYAMLEDTSTKNIARGVLKTSDKGHTWAWMAAPTASGGLFQGTGPDMTTDGGQGFYNHGLGVDPTNPQRLVMGANLALYRSMDGGATWSQLTHWYGSGHPYTHADNHATAWSNGTLYVANDGGLAILKDPWRATIPTATDELTFIDNRRNKGLSSHLVYNVGSTTAASPADSKWRISLGLQDNGTRVRQPNTPGGTLTGNEGTFEDGIGGDGFGTVIHPTDGSQILGSVYYTDIYKSIDGGTTFTESISGISEAKSSTAAPFAPKIALGATATPGTVYTSVNTKVYLSTDFGSSWTSMSMGTFASSGRVIRNVNGSRSTSAVGMASSGGHFWTTYNGGAAWTDSGDVTNGNLSTSYIWFDTENDQVVYGATVAPYATAHHLFKSANGGATWTPLDGSAATSNGLPFGIPVHVIQNRPGHSNILFAGTDFGVYQSTDGGITWARYGSNLPLVATRDLYISPDGGFIRAGTYGRGVWEVQTLGITLDKTTANVNPSASATFTATVTGFPSSNLVNWSVSTGGGGFSPTQTASGTSTVYTAPAVPGIYTITAATIDSTSLRGTPAIASASVNVYSPASVTVTIAPAIATLAMGGTATFNATVANAPSQDVTWSANGGTITTGGVYTAPLAPGTYNITATSIWPGTTPGTATVSVKTLDVNADGVVDLQDLLFFAKYYGTTNASCLFSGDLTVSDADLAILLAGL